MACRSPVPQPPASFIVFFHFDSSDLTPEARQIVGQAAQKARSSHASTVTIAGYTDQAGSPHYNLHLADRRIAAVEQALVTDGVDPRLFLRIPLPDAETALEPTADRRVEIRLATKS
jgi:outer membrane protein OmpA-like peptidoglycan-associated protein